MMFPADEFIETEGNQGTFVRYVGREAIFSINYFIIKAFL